jgi:hypothetical protein
MDKHLNLFCPFFSDKEKSFITLTPGLPPCQVPGVFLSPLKIESKTVGGSPFVNFMVKIHLIYSDFYFELLVSY